MTLKFWKVESIGNDFPLFQATDLAGVDLAELARVAANRRFGIGGDGILVVGNDLGRVSLRMFNPDGSEDFCGNGLRCAALFAQSQGWVGEDFSIDHGAEQVPVRMLPNGVVQTTLEAATYEPAKVPQNGETLFNEVVWAGMLDGQPYCLYGSALSTGSTHVVIPTADLPADEPFQSVSARIEHDIRFPQRTSVMWSHELEPDLVEIRIWERGAGETLGCGTGSSAVAVDYLRRKGRGGTVTVRNPGGDLQIELAAWNSPIVVRGTPKMLFEGEYQPKFG